ncbi:CMP-N,N'-diacetyllegionaminic acid synthase [bacterium HR36]|nr:CMP-N,N'-diacetyllegionaminic acid synthase [bacterium HR36]
MNAKVLTLIPARGGSQAIPKKNIVPLGGKPLIAWTIEVARRTPELEIIVVSTDSAEIAAIAKQYGADVPFLRPAELARSDSPTIDAVLHALDWLAEHRDYRPEAILLLQPTSPFRSVEDIKAALRLYEESRAPAVVSVTPCHPHPYLAYRIDADGCLEPHWGKEACPARRQDLPHLYYLNGAIYLVKATVLLAEKTFLPRGTRALIMPPERSLDIDEPFDLMLARCIVEGNLWREPSRSEVA